MNNILWLLQILLAGLFFRDGTIKFFKPETLKAQRLGDLGLLLFIGASEMLGAIGLILPAATRVFPWLTPAAAGGIAVIMILAARFRLQRREAGAAGFAFALMTLSLFVVYGRCFLSPL
jgi:hypothetical protein